jgi:hypothetical protein
VVTATDVAVNDRPDVPTGWPLQPLLDASGLTASRLSLTLGLSGTTVRLARRRGLTDAQADEWSIRLGLHPLLVWGWAWIEEANSAARRPAHVRAAALLRDRVARGELRPGDRLPGVHALARQLGVGSRTMVRALDELRAEGLVVGGVGRGRHARVASTVPTGATSCVACGRVIEAGEEHYPHRPFCTMASHGWCDCDEAAHPECCPSCAGGGS